MRVIQLVICAEVDEIAQKIYPLLDVAFQYCIHWADNAICHMMGGKLIDVSLTPS